MRYFRFIACIMMISMLGMLHGCQTKKSSPLNEESPEILEEWYDTVYGLVSFERLNPPRASRVYAYFSIALYEGLVHGFDDLKSLSGQLNELENLPEPEQDVVYDWITVGLVSQHHVASYLFKDASLSTLNQLDQLHNKLMEQRRSENGNHDILARSEEFGVELADHLIDWIGKDGFYETQEMVYSPPKGEEQWIPTAEYGTSLALNDVSNIVHLYDDLSLKEAEEIMQGWTSDHMLVKNRPQTITDQMFAIEPHWNTIRPLVMSSDSLIPAEPQVPYSTDPESRFYKEAYEVYEVVNEAGEKENLIAEFWADCPGETGTPPGHWVQIIGDLIAQYELDLKTSVKAYTFMTISMMDAFIANWHEKYTNNLLRPETYIKRHIDDGWNSVLIAPAFPEYPSGHSTASASAATTLIDIIGDVGFVDHTHQNRYGFEPRRFDSLTEAMEEAAQSRLYGGIHYPMANNRGLRQGEKVAEHVLGNLSWYK